MHTSSFKQLWQSDRNQFIPVEHLKDAVMEVWFMNPENHGEVRALPSDLPFWHAKTIRIPRPPIINLHMEAGKKKNHGWQRLQPKSCCTTWPDSCTSTGPLTKHNNIVLLVSPRASQSRHLRPRSNRSQCALANWEVLWNSMSFMPYIFCEYPTCIYIYIYSIPF